MSVSCPPVRWPIYTPSTTPARPIPTDSTLGGTATAPTSIVDLDRRAEDKTTASALILGNSGQGKSYLLKLLLCSILEAGKVRHLLGPGSMSSLISVPTWADASST